MLSLQSASPYRTIINLPGLKLAVGKGAVAYSILGFKGVSQKSEYAGTPVTQSCHEFGILGMTLGRIETTKAPGGYGRKHYEILGRRGVHVDISRQPLNSLQLDFHTTHELASRSPALVERESMNPKRNRKSRITLSLGGRPLVPTI